MLQRSAEALYSNCAGDKPRTCSASICVVISKCTRRCSRSSLAIGAANKGADNKQTVSVRIVQPRNLYLRSLFIVKSMVVRAIPETHHLDDQSKGRSSHPERWKRRIPRIADSLCAGAGVSARFCPKKLLLTEDHPPNSWVLHSIAFSAIEWDCDTVDPSTTPRIFPKFDRDIVFCLSPAFVQRVCGSSVK